MLQRCESTVMHFLRWECCFSRKLLVVRKKACSLMSFRCMKVQSCIYGVSLLGWRDGYEAVILNVWVAVCNAWACSFYEDSHRSHLRRYRCVVLLFEATFLNIFFALSLLCLEPAGIFFSDSTFMTPNNIALLRQEAFYCCKCKTLYWNFRSLF